MKSKAKTVRNVSLGVLAVLALLIGFICWWPMGQEDGRIDLSRKLIGVWAAAPQKGYVSGAPMSLSGGVAFGQGRKGQALVFDGGPARVTVPDGRDLAIGPGQSLTIMAWIRPEQADRSRGIMSIVEKRQVNGLYAAKGFCLNLVDGHLASQVSPAPGFDLRKVNWTSPTSLISEWKNRKALVFVGPNIFETPGPDLRDGAFHHVAVTLDRSSANVGRIYADGQVVLKFDLSKLRGSLATSEPLLIGTHPDPALVAGFKGVIEDVRLYSRALSQAEIEAAAKQ